MAHAPWAMSLSFTITAFGIRAFELLYYHQHALYYAHPQLLFFALTSGIHSYNNTMLLAWQPLYSVPFLHLISIHHTLFL